MLIDFNATNDPQVRRREDLMKLDGRKGIDYRYQVREPSRSSNAVAEKVTTEAGLRSAISHIGKKAAPAIA